MTETRDRLYEKILVLRCQAGDHDAFAELVERYQPGLQYFLRKMLRDCQSADDALQDVWLNTFRNVSRLTDVGAFRGWLYRIARDRAFAELRNRRPVCQPLEAELADGGTGEDEYSAVDVEAIHAALDDLEPEHREVLVLRYVEGMAYDEIASVVGCLVGTVRSRLHYAKRALRSALERMNFDEREGTGSGPPQAR